ncbi:MAG: putative metalloprotease CJM1_0395 family protein [Pseudomonadota bacterium]
MSIAAVTANAVPPATAQRVAPARAGAGAPTELTPQALVLIDKLRARDAEVRQHEQAHLAAAGGLAVSGASYTYQRGPNGVDYAVGGEVHIDTSPGRTPQETISRAHTIQAAALAPAEPSGPDRAVAAQAQQLEQQARAELATAQAQQALAPGQQDGTAATSSIASPHTAAPPAAAAASADPRRQALQRAYDIAPLVPPTLNVVA